MLTSEIFGILLTDIWSEASGRIFLLSIIYYLFSSFVSAGYFSFFSGGYSSILSGDLGLIDLLFLFPTVVVSLFKIFVENLGSFLLAILLRIILPFLIGIGLAAINESLFNFVPENLLLWAITIATIIWAIGLGLTTWSSKKCVKNLIIRFLSFIFQALGTYVVFTLAMLVESLNRDVNQFSSPNDIPALIYMVDLTFMIFLIIVLLTGPIAIGKTIAKIMVRDGLLSQIERLELTVPVIALQDYSEAGHYDCENKSSIIKSILGKKDKKKYSDLYSYKSCEDIFLVASLNQVIAIYIENQNEHENIDSFGKLLMLSRSSLNSFIIRSDS